MNYGLSPAEQAAQRAQQRGLVASSVPPPADTRRATFAEYARQSPISEKGLAVGFGSPFRNLQPPIPYTPRSSLPPTADTRMDYELSPAEQAGRRAQQRGELRGIFSKPPLGALPTPSPLGLSEVRQMINFNLRGLGIPPGQQMQQGPYTPRPGWTGFGQPPVGVGNVGGNYGSRLAGSVGGNYQPPVGNWRDLFRPSSYRIFGDALDPFQRRPMPTRPPTRYPTSGMPVEGF